jgi:UDP-N-acetylglucosamine 2-epimerase
MKTAVSETGTGKAERFTVQVFIGTRPEYIKLAPLLQRLSLHSEDIRVVSVHTRQHATLGIDTGRYFGVTPSMRLPSPSEPGAAPALSTTHRNLLRTIDEAVHQTSPDLILVQGDTLTALAAAQCAFHHHVPVAHVEAGLRTHRFDQPWPEEILRVTISRLSRWHYAPTETARRNLLDEGVDDSRILVTGNTVVDAFRTLLSGLDEATSSSSISPLRILLTLHRRENFGDPQLRIAHALRTFLTRHPGQVELLALSHPNPESSRHLPLPTRP